MMETEEEFQTRIGMEGQNAMREPVEEEKNIFAPMEEEKNMSALAEEEKNIFAYVEKIREELHETVDREIDNFLLRLENGELLESKSGLEREIPLSAMPAYFKGKNLWPSSIRMVRRRLPLHGKKRRCISCSIVRRNRKCLKD